jgi:hypothetical protein
MVRFSLFDLAMKMTSSWLTNHDSRRAPDRMNQKTHQPDIVWRSDHD